MFKPVFIVNDKVVWSSVCYNTNALAICILEQNMDKVDWQWLSLNPSAIHILEQNLDKMDWGGLFSNPNANHLLKKCLDKADLHWLSSNLNAIHLLTNLDTVLMRENCKTFAEELAAYVFHPLRIQNISNAYGYELDEYIEYFM